MLELRDISWELGPCRHTHVGYTRRYAIRHTHIFWGLFWEKKCSQEQGDEEEEGTGNHASKAWRWQEETGRRCGKGRRVETVPSAGPATWDATVRKLPACASARYPSLCSGPRWIRSSSPLFLTLFFPILQALNHWSKAEVKGQAFNVKTMLSHLLGKNVTWMCPSLLLQSFISRPSQCPSRSLPIICFLMASAVRKRHRNHVSYCLSFCIHFLVAVIKDISQTQGKAGKIYVNSGGRELQSWGQQLRSWSHHHAWAQNPGGGKCNRRISSFQEGKETLRERGGGGEGGWVRRAEGGREMGKEGWREKGEGRLII